MFRRRSTSVTGCSLAGRSGRAPKPPPYAYDPSWPTSAVRSSATARTSSGGSATWADGPSCARAPSAADAASAGQADTDELVRQAMKRIDQAAAKGVIHKNEAARRKSRLARTSGAASAKPAQPAKKAPKKAVAKKTSAKKTTKRGVRKKKLGPARGPALLRGCTQREPGAQRKAQRRLR